MNIYKVPTYYSMNDLIRDLPDDPTLHDDDTIEAAYEKYKEELEEEFKADDLEWLQRNMENCKEFGSKTAKSILYRIVKDSVNKHEDDKSAIAAANAISILKIMNVSLSCLDLKGIQIPRADLSGAILDDANLSRANLKDVNLTNASLNRAKLYKADLTGIKLGVQSLLSTSTIRSFTVSPNGKLAIIRIFDQIQVWDIEKQEKLREKKWDTSLKMSQIICIDDAFFIIGDKKGVHLCRISNLEKIETIKRDSVQPGVSSYLSFALSLNKELLIVVKPHEGSTEISVRRVERSNEKDPPKFPNIIEKIYVSYHINQVFFSVRNKASLITTSYLSNGTIELRDPETLKITKKIENVGDVKFCDFVDEKSIIALIQNTLYTISLDDSFKTGFKSASLKKTAIFREVCRIRSLCYFTHEDKPVIAYIKDNIDSCPSICFIFDFDSKKSLSADNIYTYDAFDYKIDSIYVSQDGNLLFQISYETGKVYIQRIDSIKKQADHFNKKAAASHLSLVSHISFSAAGEKIIAIGKDDAAKSPLIYTYNTLNGELALDSKEKTGLVENEVSSLSYSLSDDASYIVQKKKVLFKRDKDSSLQALEYQFELLSLNDINESRGDQYTTTMALSYNGTFSSFVKNNQLEIWDIHGKQLCICDNVTLKPKLGFDIKDIKVIAVSPEFSRDGGYIACTDETRVAFIKLQIQQNASLTIDVEHINHPDTQILDLKFTQNMHRLIVVGEDTVLVQGIDNDYKHTCIISKYIDKEKADVEDLLEDKPPTFAVSSDGKLFLTCKQGDEIVKDKTKLYYEEQYNVLRLIDIKTGEKIGKKEITPGPIALKFSPKNNLFVTWLWKSNSIQMWHYTDRTIQLLWRNRSNLEAHKLDITKAIGLSNHAKERLIYAGAIERIQ